MEKTRELFNTANKKIKSFFTSSFKEVFKNKYFFVPAIFVLIFVGVFAFKYLNILGVQASGVEIANSQRFNGTNASLTRTPGSSGSANKFTYSTWLKKSKLSTQMYLLNADVANTGSGEAIILSSSDIFGVTLGGGAGATVYSTAKLRDPSAWYHIVIAVDTTQAVSTERVKLYLNGSRLVNFDFSTFPSLNYSFVNLNVSGITHHFAKASNASSFLDGYLADTYYLDGQALPPTSFAMQDTTTGQWVPIAYSGAYGTNGFHLDYADSANPGTDVSGQTNNFTNNNLTVNDQVIDTPTNNFPTINPLNQNYITGGGVTPIISNGNLTTQGGYSLFYGTTIKTGSTGKYYWELTHAGTGGAQKFTCLYKDNYNVGSNTHYSISGNICYGSSGSNFATGLSTSGTPPSYTIGDVISVLYDADGGTVKFWKNGVDTTWVISGVSGQYYAAIDGLGSGSYEYSTINFGQGGQAGLTYDAASGGRFKYTPTAGYKALSTDNLPDPAIPQGFAYFDSAKYAGTGAPQSIGNFAFQPNIVWIKDMTSANLSGIWDSVRNVVTTSSLYLISNATTAGTAIGTTITAYLSNGFTIGASTLVNKGTTVASSTSFTYTSQGNVTNSYSTPYGAATYGNYMYVSSNGDDRIDVYDISTPASPVLLGNFSAACTPGDIAVYGTSLYVTNYTANNFRVYDLSVSATNPTFVRTVTTGTYPIGIRASPAGYIYVANNTTNNISIFNAASTTNPTLSATFALPSNNPVGIGISGTALYVTHYNQSLVRVLNIATPAAPVNVTTLTVGNNPMGVGVFGNTLVVSNFGSNTLHQFNITAPLAPTASTVATFSAGGTSPAGMTFSTDGSYLYVMNNGSTNFTKFSSIASANDQYVAWAWKESPTSGMDTVTYTGTGANRTIAHSLAATPTMMIVKRTDSTGNWFVYNGNLSNTQYLTLNSTAAATTDATAWNSATPTATVFSVGTNAAVNANGGSYIAYLFRDVDGFSKFGKYTGNGLADGTFIYTGFKPKYVMYKRTNSTENWGVYDTARDSINPTTGQLSLNLNSASSSGTIMDILSNGFKFRNTAAGGNVSAGTYVYAAFAEYPFKEQSTPYNLTMASSTRFNGTNAYVTRTPGVAGNRQKWTWSAWVKNPKAGGSSSYTTLFESGPDGNNFDYFTFNSTGSLQYQLAVGGSILINKSSAALFRDPSTWYHVVLAVDTTSSTVSNRVRMYVNGVELTSFSTEVNPSQNQNTWTNSTNLHRYSNCYTCGGGVYFDNYFSDAYIVDGQQLTPASFGEYNTNGIWRPKTYSGTYGTNGVRLPFTNSASPGQDTSGNGNNYTAVNIATTDIVADNPTNNFSIWNPLNWGHLAGVTCSSPSAPTMSEGNLYVTGAATSNCIYSNIGVSSGKFYWEYIPQNGNTGGLNMGIVNLNYPNGGSYVTYEGSSGNTYVGSTYSAYGASYTTGDVIGVALDMDTKTVTFYKNNVSQGVAATGLTGSWAGLVFDGAVGHQWRTNFGQGGQAGLTYDSASGGYFKYTPPTGFKALSTNNLPSSTIPKGSDYFNAVTYYGDGTSARNITSLNFEPGLIWVKDLTTAVDHVITSPTLVSSSSLAYLTSTANTIETSLATGLTAFLTSGFTIGNSSLFNTSSNNYIAWAWKESPTAGIDIVAYTGIGSASTTSQNISTIGAYDWETYTIGGNTYAIVANNYNGASYSVNSYNFIWQTANNCFGNGTTCGTPLQSIATIGARDWEVYTIGANTYAIVANNYNGASYNINSSNYIWMSGSSCFGNGSVCGTALQSIATNGAQDWETYTIGSDTYALVANNYNGTTYSINSSNYIWMSGSSCFGNGSVCGTALQSIATYSSRDWETFTDGVDTYAVVANTGTVNDGYSRVYIWMSGSSCFGDGTTCGTQKQNISGYTDSDIEIYTISGSIYMLSGSNTNSGFNSSNYIWMSGSSCFGNGTTCGTAQQSITSSANSDKKWKVYTIGSKTLATQTVTSPQVVTHIWMPASNCWGNGTICASSQSGSIQVIPLFGYDWDVFSVGTSTYALMAINRFGSSFSTVSSLYNWTGSCWGTSTSTTCQSGQSPGAIIPHSLESAPTFVMVKNRGVANAWAVYHSSLSSITRYLSLNTTAAETTDSTVWVGGPASNPYTFTVGTSALTNTSGNNYIAYLFRDVEGFSKFSSYTGNGSADGPFIYTGFKPRFIMVKANSTTGNWVQLDTARDNFNVATSSILANTTAAQTAANTVDFLSNGFKIRNTGADYNTNAVTYVYAAFAEQPFKYGAGANIATSSAMGGNIIQSVITTIANWFWMEF